MYLLAKHIDNGLYVELGVEKGRGSGCLAAGGPNAQVIGLDHTRREELGPLLAEFTNFTFLERPSLPALETIDEPVNILHIDTEHSYAMAHEEFKAYQRYLASGAVVLFDDLHAREDDVLKFFYSLPYPKFQDDRLHPSCGAGIRKRDGMKATFFKDLAKQAEVMDPLPDPRFPPSVYYRFFRLLAASLHPTLSVELGTCGGGGALHTALGWPDGKVVGIDADRAYAENIAYVEERCPNFQFMWGDSVMLAPEVGKIGTVDILFIDTRHTYEQTWDEFNAYRPFLARDAVICLDDLFRPGMEEVWYELPVPHRIRLDKLHIGGAPTDGGFGVLWF
jgi:predicted O-methyltransferase YrrM